MRFHCHPIILADHPSHIVSLPRRSGLLRKIMSRLLRTSSTRLRGESWRPTMKWVNYRSDYPRFVAKNANGENGSIYLMASQVSYFMPLSLTMCWRSDASASSENSGPMADVKSKSGLRQTKRRVFSLSPFLPFRTSTDM